MNFRNILRESWSAMQRHWIRSVLTILGIGVGVGAFICVVAIGNAGSSSIEDKLQSLGDNFDWEHSSPLQTWKPARPCAYWAKPWSKTCSGTKIRLGRQSASRVCLVR